MPSNLQVHVRVGNSKTDVIHRLPYTKDLTAEELESALRQLVPSLHNVQICFADAEGMVLSMEVVFSQRSPALCEVYMYS